MNMLFRPLLIASLCVPLLASAQLMSDADAKDQMKYDVKYLASDLEMVAEEHAIPRG